MTIIENRKVPTIGRILGVVAVTLTIVLGAGSVLIPMILNNANASTVPELRRDIDKTASDVGRLRDDVDVLKDRRGEDIGEMRSMRAEILQHLDRIDSKLDQKADKTEPVRGWTR